MAGPVTLYFDVWPAATPDSGAALGELTQAYGKKIQDVLSDTGAGQFTINRHDSQAAWCATGNLVRVRFVGGGPFAWNSANYKFAFYIEDGDDAPVDPDEEAGEEWIRGGRGILAVLERLRWYTRSFIVGGAGPRADLKWHWVNDQFGDIYLRGLSEWNNRPSPKPIPATITDDFSSTTDSDGTSWPSFDGEFTIDVGTDYLAGAFLLCDQGIEIGMTPAFLARAWVDGGRGTDKTATVAFRKGWNIRHGGGRKIYASKRATRMLVKGTAEGTAEAAIIEVTDASTSADESGKWGRREGYVTYERSPDTAPLTRAGQQALAQLRTQDVGPIAIGVTSYGAGTDGGSPPAKQDFLPYTDYDVGDLITLDIAGEYANESKRIVEITIAEEDDSNGEAEVTLTLGGEPFDPSSAAGAAFTDPTGGSGCGCNIPHPVPVCVADTVVSPSTVWHATYTTDDKDDESSTYDFGLDRVTIGGFGDYGPAAAFFGNSYGRNNAGAYASQKLPWSDTDDCAFSMDILWRYTPSNRNVDLRWYAGTTLLRTDRVISGAGKATNVGYSDLGATVTPPSGADGVVVYYTNFAGLFGDNITLQIPGSIVAADNDENCIPEGGSSPYFARSDDPRFDEDDQHLITRLVARATNNSGGALEAGDIVVPEIGGGPAVVTTTTAAQTDSMVGLVLEGGADGEQITVGWMGTFRARVAATAAIVAGDYLFTSTTPGEADPDATMAAGAFAQVTSIDGDDEATDISWWGWPTQATGGGGSGETIVKDLTNKSGASVAAGDVVVISGANADAFTTTTVAQSVLPIGVAMESIADNAVGAVALAGYVPLVNVPSAVTLRHYAETNGTAKQAVGNATRRPGSFGVFLTGSSTPDAILFGSADLISAGHEAAADPHSGYLLESILDTKGDLIAASAADTPGKLAAGSNGQKLVARSGETLGLKWEDDIATLNFIIDNGGVALTTGIKGDLIIDFDCTILSATLLADQSGSVVVDIWKDTYGNYPPTDADSITASAPPTISSAVKSQDSTLTGWTTSIAAGQTLRYNVDSATTITRVTVSLKLKKT